MNWFLIVILVLAIAFFIWQSALFVRDLIKHIKKKKEDKKKQVENPSSDDGRKE